MDMYREVVRSPQYAARKRAVLQSMDLIPKTTINYHQKQHHYQNQKMIKYQQQQINQYSKHNHNSRINNINAQQLRNSKSHPNLTSIQTNNHNNEPILNTDIYKNQQIYQDYPIIQAKTSYQQVTRNHLRTNSQPDYIKQIQNGDSNIYNSNDQMLKNDHVQQELTVKPFLSTQDIRLNSLLSSKQLHDIIKQNVDDNDLIDIIGHSYYDNLAASQPIITKIDNMPNGQAYAKVNNYSMILYVVLVESDFDLF